MRRVRTLVAGSALGFAALTLAVPAAYADGQPAPHNAPAAENGSGEKSHSSEGKWTPEKEAEKKYEESDKGGEGSYEKSSHEKSWKDHKSPHGGVHTGIGGAFLDDGAALGTGAALIAGGVGMGVYALRRRPSAVAAQA
ncbi:hypothetical protein [Embleya sp. NBC_00896]|uniref:hypothetical protein n=1 Tax=Embleya sp. NBC_00896 TaxID=2975961 RepID=UPI002F90AC47|nr:hypothetical protein OG928_42005 [Embleya sp. NBC_00896]